jgi:hypothetical protein
MNTSSDSLSAQARRSMTGDAANPREAAAKPIKRRRSALTMFNTRHRQGRVSQGFVVK